MRKSGAERQREYLRRKRDRAEKLPDPTDDFISSAEFAAYLRDDPDNLQLLGFMKETLDSFGMEAPDLTVDHDPDFLPEWEKFGSQNRGALGRAERMAGGLIDCGQQLAEAINRFKLAQIEKELARLAEADLTNPAARKDALGKAVQLDKMKSALGRKHRREIPAITVRGEL